MYDCTEDVLNHIGLVKKHLNSIADHITLRGLLHDASKLHEPEKSIFDEYTPKLKECEFLSEEYKINLLSMKPALEHHYSCNAHHIEFHKDGIKGMTLIDLMEMIADWKAATELNKNGDIVDSINKNQDRFGYSDELKEIFLNTVEQYLR